MLIFKQFQKMMIAITTIFFCMLTFRSVQASTVKKPNTGSYIYQYKSVLSQQQIDEINSINDNLRQSKTPQEIFVVILPSLPKSSVPSDTANGVDIGNNYGTDMLSDFSGHQADTLDKQGKLDTDDSYTQYLDKLEYRQNLLILTTNDHQVGLATSDFTSDYFTDFRWWRLRFGLNHGMNASGPRQINAFVKLFKRVSRATGKVAAKTSQPKGLTWYDFWGKVGADVIVLIAIWLIYIFIKYLRKGGSGGGPDEDNYDDGFYDGYVQRGFQDHQDNNNPFL